MAASFDKPYGFSGSSLHTLFIILFVDELCAENKYYYYYYYHGGVISPTLQFVLPSWGKPKETIIATFKAIVQSIIEYASTIWSPVITTTNLQKLQSSQNNALRIVTGCNA